VPPLPPCSTAVFGAKVGGRSDHATRHRLRVVACDPAIVGHVALTIGAVQIGGQAVDIVGMI